MSAVRSSHIHRLRQYAPSIFGAGFQQEWFSTGFNRKSLPEFQRLLGAVEGAEYPLLPPILYPNGKPDKNMLFLNPALAKVRSLICSEILARHAHTCADIEGHAVWTFVTLQQEVVRSKAERGKVGAPRGNSWYDSLCGNNSESVCVTYLLNDS